MWSSWAASATERPRCVRHLAGTGRAGPHRVDGEVSRDRVEPWSDRATLGADRLRVLPGAQQGLLDDVLGTPTVARGEPEDVLEQGARVLVVQPAQDGLVSV